VAHKLRLVTGTAIADEIRRQREVLATFLLVATSLNHLAAEIARRGSAALWSVIGCWKNSQHQPAHQIQGGGVMGIGMALLSLPSYDPQSGAPITGILASTMWWR